jgi:hypothetical protein
MAGEDREIGLCRCPVCGSDRGRLKVSKKSLAYIVCSACHVQVFARSDHSDSLLRGFGIAKPAAAAPTPEPAPVVKPGPTPAPEPAPKKSEPAWGLKW